MTGHTNYLEKLKTAVNRKFGSREALNTIITASQHGQTDYIRKLIEQGVNVNSTNKEGNTALHFAARYENYADSNNSMTRWKQMAFCGHISMNGLL